MRSYNYSSGFLTILLIFISTIRLPAQDMAVSDSLPLSIEQEVHNDTAWVVVDKDTLWPVYMHIGPFTAKERAKRTTEILTRIRRKHRKSLDSVKVVREHEGMALVIGEDQVAYVFPEDAEAAGTGMGELAISYVNMIKPLAKPRPVLMTMEDLGFRFLKLLGIIVALFIIIKLLKTIFRNVQKMVFKRLSNKLKGIRIKDLEIVNPHEEMRYIQYLIKAFRVLVIVVLIYLTLPVAFKLFPWTEDLAEELVKLVLDPLIGFFWAFIHYIPDLITIVIIIFIGRGILKFLKYLADQIESGKLVIKGFYPEWGKPTYNIVSILIYAFLLVLIFPLLPGSDSMVFKGVSVFIGVLFTMGSSTAVSNAVAGLVLTYMRPYNIGDMVELEGERGVVIEKSLLVTRIKTPKQEIVTIPNSQILAKKSVNFSASQEQGKSLIISVSITIGYDVPWTTVHELLLEAAGKTEGVLDKPVPFVLQKSLNDFYVEYEINVHIEKVRSMMIIRSNLNRRIQDSFRDAGIEILSPHYRANRDGNESTVPKKTSEEDVLKATGKEPAKKAASGEKKPAESAKKKAGDKQSGKPADKTDKEKDEEKGDKQA